jgi:hypothetical protein
MANLMKFEKHIGNKDSNTTRSLIGKYLFVNFSRIQGIRVTSPSIYPHESKDSAQLRNLFEPFQFSTTRRRQGNVRVVILSFNIL